MTTHLTAHWIERFIKLELIIIAVKAFVLAILFIFFKEYLLYLRSKALLIGGVLAVAVLLFVLYEYYGKK